MDRRPKLALVKGCGMNLRTGSAPRLRVNIRSKAVSADSGGRLDSERHSGASLSPIGGDLPEIPGVRIELLGERDSTGHVGDVLGEVHTDDTIAICYLESNSTLRADKSSRLLHHPVVGKISEIEQLRRSNLSRLRKEFGKVQLAEATGLPVSFLYHMSDAKGKNARPVSDENAKLIEDATGKPPGWLDLPDNHNVQPIGSARKKAPEWPFPFSYRQLMSLDEPVREAAITAAASIVAQARKPAAKERRKGSP